MYVLWITGPFAHFSMGQMSFPYLNSAWEGYPMFYSPPHTSRPKSNIFTLEAFYYLCGISDPTSHSPAIARCMSGLYHCILFLTLFLKTEMLFHLLTHNWPSINAAWMKKWRNEGMSLCRCPAGAELLQGQGYLFLQPGRCWGNWPSF